MLQKAAVLWVFCPIHFLVLSTEITISHIHTLITSLNSAKFSPQQLPAGMSPVV